MAYKQSPFPLIAGTSPVKSITRLKLLAKGAQIVKNVGKKLFTKTKTKKAKDVFLKHDIKSGHLRFQTALKGGKGTGEHIAVSGKAGGSLTLDTLRKSILPKGMDFTQASKLAKRYNTPKTIAKK